MTFFYVPIESLKARYTSQLCEQWMPAAFDTIAKDLPWTKWQCVEAPAVSENIKTGSVLDAVNRGIVCLSQMQSLLENLDSVATGDVIFLQDMWTPGIEAVLYALHLQGKKVRIYAMCHAQSVDEYDFTYPMRDWMRPIELGWTNAFAGLFVASTIHREQLRAAGVKCPIHVVGLPIDPLQVFKQVGPIWLTRQKQVVFSSRLNNEKNPYFMLAVAEEFLAMHPDWTWVVTTSAEQFSTDVPNLLHNCFKLMERNPRFQMCAGLTKQGYYDVLRRSAIQFNCSLQDYVSWTLLEACLMGCDLCYPNFRSFPECLDPAKLYQAFNVPSALRTLEVCIDVPQHWMHVANKCNNGRLIEMAIMLNNWQGPEVNIWHQPAEYFEGVGLL